MASPQKENGFTPIAHDILEALSKHVLSPDEWRVLMVIFRKTYGWDKKEDWISHSQFSEITGINRCHVPRIIKKLVSRNIIYRGVTQLGNPVTQSGNSNSITYGFQKDFDKWTGLPKQVTPLPNQDQGVTQSGSRGLPDQVHTKETIQKKLQKKISRTSHPLTTDEYVEKLKTSPNYTHIDWNYELEEMRLWALKPENRGRVINPRFILNWIKKKPRPLSLVVAKQDIKPARVMMDGVLKECIKGEWVEVKA